MRFLKPVKMRRFLREESGLAMVEFALVIPILLVFLLGATELSRSMLINQKIEKANATVADVVAQSSSIVTSDLTTLMTAIGDMVQPFPFATQGRVIISSVSRTGTSTKVRWQYCGGGTFAAVSRIGVVNGNAILPTGLTLPDGEDIVVTETFYSFTPLLGNRILKAGTLYKVAYFKPRLGALSTYVSSCS